MLARRAALAVAGAFVLAFCISCRDTTAPVRRFAVLDDVGQSDWASVSAGGDHTCAIKTDGTAYCWGSNQYGQLGLARTDTACGLKGNKYACSLTPQLVPGGLKFSSISAGQRHTCAITTDRRAFCWGGNDAGQVSDIGNGGPTMMQVPGTLPWVQVSAGYTHSCAVRSDGVLFCWGSNDRGQLGNGGVGSGNGLVRASLSGAVASVATGQSRTCARTTSGSVFCWGAIWQYRQNGLEFTRAQVTPQAVPGAPSLASVTVGSFTTCGTDRTGLAYCWEANPRGGMGTGTLDGSTTPEPIAGALQFVQMTAGILQTCGLSTSGTAYCWGDNSFGQLGVPGSALAERCVDGTLPCATRPVAVVGRQQFEEISTGFGSHTCGVTLKGNLYCWGLGGSGQRGDGSMSNASATPIRVTEPPRA